MTKNSRTPDESLEAQDGIVKLPTRDNVRKHKSAISQLMDKLESIRADIKSQYERAENDGVDPKALKAEIKEARKPTSPEQKFLRNHIRRCLGQGDLFSVTLSEASEDAA